MAATTPNMGLAIWDQLSDYFNHSELQANFEALDDHDHTTGKGTQIPEGGLAPGSVTALNLKDNAISGNKIVNGSIIADKLGANSVSSTNIQNGAVTSSKLGTGGVRGIESLRIIRGTVNTAGSGSITQGNGFTISRTGTGNLTVTFTTVFSAVPSVTATPNDAYVIRRNAISASSVQIQIYTTGLSAVDASFDFTAIGPA